MPPNNLKEQLIKKMDITYKISQFTQILMYVFLLTAIINLELKITEIRIVSNGLIILNFIAFVISSFMSKHYATQIIQLEESQK